MNYDIDVLKRDLLPKWALNRIYYNENKDCITSKIQENNLWIEYFSIRGIYNVVPVFRERILIFLKLLIDYEKDMQIPEL